MRCLGVVKLERRGLVFSTLWIGKSSLGTWNSEVRRDPWMGNNLQILIIGTEGHNPPATESREKKGNSQHLSVYGGVKPSTAG